MKIVMTMMVRDEADIVRAALEHALRQGVDYFIVTDNGSVDGTTEILEEFAARGVLELRHDPIHRKQQSETVSAMASDAYTKYGADWVINADADEFWVAQQHGRTVRDVLEETPKSYQAFLVQVVDMTGLPAAEGGGVHRLRYRDNRTTEQLNEVGLRSHSTPDAVHIGTSGIVVSQGNHLVSLESNGAPAAGEGLEVLHLPWRSWAQYLRKVENAGRSYENNPEAKPSPNHHGMREYQRMHDGTLLGHYIARHPSAEQLAAGIAEGLFVEDARLADMQAFASPEVEFTPQQMSQALEGLEPILRAEAREFQLSARLQDAIRESESASSEVDELRLALDSCENTVREYRSRRAVKAVDFITRKLSAFKR